MTGPTNPVDVHRATTQKLIADTSRLWNTAAAQSDSAEGLGIDGRIGLVHGLIDAWVKAYVAFLETLIKSGGCLPVPSTLGPPLPSEEITVTPRTFPRDLEFVGPLVRVGLPEVTIQPPAVAFDPPFLPAGIDRFRIVLVDHRFIGSNYAGTVRLSSSAAATNLSPQDLVPDEVSVTVGL
ncbi:hypothetical protein [Mycobacterium sp. NAZ190054]|uniref:hypothetical protein n=1 Tax=Mycobacterium sp. NAZ190054 TaxID=1747766 RepID=UPI000792A497|nr:hypothetical protein [Mycobacterium sp. NAZ190054]KWX67567.1 hypothetical protein ASJ79_21340 [Mycobacterium sp. NAZ190054]